MMVIDGEELYLLGFNFTHLDIDRSRSFGIVTRRKIWVDEAERLFAADATRQLYSPSCESFIVSPGNARRNLMGMLSAGKRQLLIYDDKLSDPDVMRLLALKVREGLDVRVIGAVGKRALGVKTSHLHMRLHAQVIIRDGEEMFLGSQSLRSLELDVRREAGIVTDDPDIIAPVLATFEADWARASGVRAQDCCVADTALIEGADGFAPEPVPAPLPPEVSAELVKAAVKEAIKDAILERTEPNGVNVPLKDAVKEAAREALHELAC
jgi:hypothetical protein